MSKIKRELLKEIRKIQNKTNVGKWVFGVMDTYLNASEYFVVLKNGTAFYIQPGSYLIPRFNFRDVLYVRKTLFISFGNKYASSSIGYFNSNSKYIHNYEKNIMHKYRVVKILRTHSEDW